MKLFITFFLLTATVYATIFSPEASIKASGNVMDIIVHNGKITASTDAGTIESYNIKDKKLIYKMQFPKITDFIGDKIHPKIFSVDYLKTINQYLAVVQATNGARELFLIKEGKKTKLIDDKKRLFIAKAKFVDENRIMLALLSNEFILFDISKKKILYRVHVNYSHFSDFMLNEEKTIVAGGCESGEISLLDVNTGKKIKVLEGANLDNVYKVDFKKGKILGAGQDRRGSIYDQESGSYDKFAGNFLIYAGALSPSAKKAAFAFTEDNDIVIFDLYTKNEIVTLRGQKSTLNTIVFINENELVSGSDDKFIMIWRIK